MTDPTHAALERLVIMASNELDTPGPWVHTREQWDNAIAAARAALAQPTTTERPAVPEGREPAAVAGEPSDEELLDEWGKAVINFPGESWSSTALAFARAVLARWGTPNLAEIRSSLGDAPAPTAKEVGRLAAWLRNQALAFQQNGDSHHYAYRATRAADLLERQAAPAEGEVAELVRWLRMQGEAQKPGPNSLLPDQTKKERHAVGMKLTRAADLLEQFSLGGWIMPSVEQAAPAEGEVAELAAEIRHFLNGYRQMRGLGPENIYSIHRGDAMEAHITVSGLTRIADLLEQRQAAPVPVAVSERLPQPEDYLDEGWAWFFSPRVGWRQAVLPVSSAYTHWLPAHALPLPSGEVEA